MLEELGRRSALYDVDKPGEVRFGDYTENGIQLSGIIFEVNRKELKIGDRVAWETIRTRGPEDKVRCNRLWLPRESQLLSFRLDMVRSAV
jgi:hypothetical protein